MREKLDNLLRQKHEKLANLQVDNAVIIKRVEKD